MRALVLAVVFWIVLAGRAFAQTCAPVGINNGTGEYLGWGQPGQRIVWAGLTVPAGKVWLVQDIGLATTDNRQLPYAIQHLHPNGHYVPVTGMTQAAGQLPTGALGTPTAAWTGRLVLTAGSALGGRVNAPEDFATMAVLFTGWEFPDACLARLLGAEAPTSGSGPISGGPLPSFSITLQGTAQPSAP